MYPKVRKHELIIVCPILVMWFLEASDDFVIECEPSGLGHWIFKSQIKGLGLYWIWV